MRRTPLAQNAAKGDPPPMRLCVFCGSNLGVRESYLAQTRAFGAQLAERGIELVYGGAHVGLMGALADVVLAGGGRVIGVIPEALQVREIAHSGLTELHVVSSMHERKALMASLSDGLWRSPAASAHSKSCSRFGLGRSSDCTANPARCSISTASSLASLGS